MAVTIGIDHLYEDSLTSDSNLGAEVLQTFEDLVVDDTIAEFNTLIAPVHAADDSMEPETSYNIADFESETKQPESQVETAPVSAPSVPKEPEMSGMELMKMMYQKTEEKRQERRTKPRSESVPKKREKVKLRIKVGSEVDIFSASQNQWMPGVVKEIKGSKLCIQYGHKMKWLDKTSKHLKFTRTVRSNSLRENSVPSMNVDHSHPHKMEPAAFSDASSNNPFPSQGQRLSQSFDNSSARSAPAFQAPSPNQMNTKRSFNPPAINAPNPRQHPSHSHQQNQQHAQKQQRKTSVQMQKRDSIVSKPRPAANVKKNSQLDNVFVYTVEFPSNSMGIALIPYKDGRNCLVHECISMHAKQKIDPGSMVCAVNNENLLNKTYDEIHSALKKALRHPPFKVTFRAKTDGHNYQQINNVNERGTLYVKLIAGAELKHPASYATVLVGRALLKSKELPQSEENPQFDDTLCFKNFRCDHGKTAIVKVFGHKKLKHDKEIGHAEYPLPLRFNELQNDTLELKNAKDHLHGILTVHTMIKKN